MQDNNTNNQPNRHYLLDGITSQPAVLPRETRELSDIVKDKSINILERLEAYQDIISIEIGDTLFNRARNLEREVGFRQLYLKFEGGNPTGTHKDRAAFVQCLDALRRNYDTIINATCGNFGVAVALAAQLAGLRCILCIPDSYHTTRIKEIEEYGAEIVYVKGTYEDAVSYAEELAIKNRFYDANPGGKNANIQLSAYAEIAYEIYDDLRDAPKIVAAPVSNGTMLAGVYKGFVTLYKRGKTSRIPKMVAGSSSKKNSIIESFKLGLNSCKDLNPETIKETKLNEPLINWHSFDGDEALYAINTTNGWADDFSDNKFSVFSTSLREKEGLNVLPASTAGLIALIEGNKKTPLEGDRYVAILTGRK